MGKAKVATRGRTVTAERQPSRRWVLINNETGQDVTGTNPAKHPDKATWGIEDFDRACARAANMAISVTVVPAWEFYGVDDPEPEEES